ncbi:MAG: glucose-1-phosphate cytidylyltransferase [Candidatus Roseilinea sp.]|nr:MAG: glucose-1-phosphate cytidylyltransferase [Candidatus Roseilinea sp.]
MKVVILAGGFGTRISEESAVRPKPMVEIGNKPILWHIMKIYSAYGLNDFVICCGYKGHMIKEYFASYVMRHSDVTFDFRNGHTHIHRNGVEPWCVTLVDTGENTMTGGRIKRIRDYVGDETFCCTYGDGVSDVDIGKLIAFHRAQKTLATLTAVQPPGRFGVIQLSAAQTKVDLFHEKPKGDGAWVNSGFFVLEPGIFDYIEGDATVWEQEPLRRLAEDGELSAYKHEGFWHPMDTLRDKVTLEELWQKGAPWKVW